jgi:hypothetical protein
VRDRTDIAADVRELLVTRWPGRFECAQLGDDVSLGERGLCLESIEIVELLLALDDRTDDSMVAEDLLDAGPISIGRLIDHLARG